MSAIFTRFDEFSFTIIMKVFNLAVQKSSMYKDRMSAWPFSPVYSTSN